MNNIDLEDIQLKLYEKLKPSGWADKLKTFILSNDFLHILEELFAQSQDGKRFAPTLKQLFRAFEECPYNELKVVVLVSDPYPKANVADGIALSCSNPDQSIPASLNYLLNEIADTVYSEKEYDYEPDLARWSKQGILMLNASLTTTLGTTGKHAALWKPFVNYLFDMLNNYNNGLVYVFMGLNVRDWRHVVNKNNFKFFITHPANASYTNADKWDSGDLFNQVNRILKEHYNTEIKW